MPKVTLKPFEWRKLISLGMGGEKTYRMECSCGHLIVGFYKPDEYNVGEFIAALTIGFGFKEKLSESEARAFVEQSFIDFINSFIEE